MCVYIYILPYLLIYSNTRVNFEIFHYGSYTSLFYQYCNITYMLRFPFHVNPGFINHDYYDFLAISIMIPMTSSTRFMNGGFLN